MGIFSRRKQPTRRIPPSIAHNTDAPKTPKPELHSSAEFDHVMEFYYTAIKRANSIAEKNAIREYLLSLIKREWEFSSITKILYYPEQVDSGHHLSMPLMNNPYSPRKWECSISFQSKTVSLETDTILTFPWHLGRCFRTALILGKEPFSQDFHNHYGSYFRHMQFCCIYNGFHSTAAGIAFHNGELLVNEIDDGPMLENVYTDGKYWYDSISKIPIQKVEDYHEALVFQLTKEDYFDNKKA